MSCAPDICPFITEANQGFCPAKDLFVSLHSHEQVLSFETIIHHGSCCVNMTMLKVFKLQKMYVCNGGAHLYGFFKGSS